MGNKFNTPKGKYESFFAKEQKEQIEEAKRINQIAKKIAKEAEGHIPERAKDLKWNRAIREPLNKLPLKCTMEKGEIYIKVHYQDYIDQIKEAGYFKGKAEELEKQLKEIKEIPGPAPINITYPDSVFCSEDTLPGKIENEIKRLKSLPGYTKGKDGFIDTRIKGNIEGLDKAIGAIKGEY